MNQVGRSGLVSILRGTLGSAAAAALVLSIVTAPPASAQQQRMATKHVREAVANAKVPMVSRMAPATTLKLNLALPLRNEAELDELLAKIYDPESPSYRQYLTVKEFTERFGPTQEDYDAVVRFAEENGLKVTGTSPNRMLVDVTGSVKDIEAALHVNMGVYQHPTENRTFFAPDREPSANLPVALWHVTGLDNFSIPHPTSLHHVTPDAAVHPNTTGSGPGGAFIGSDFRKAYYGGTALTGAGQSVGLLEFLGYNAADVTSYFSHVGQTNTVSVVGVSTDGSSLSCTGSCDDSEQVLDIEVAISMAPGMSQVRVYVSDTSDVSIFNRMATDNSAKSLSCSWGWSPADPTSDDPIFKEFAAQGQNLFVASGDDGAFTTRSTDVYPADDAFVTAVGGTDLTTVSAGGAWKSETAWRDSGGGISPNKIAIPSWQTTAGVITTANKGSKTYRNVPDVAAEGNTDNYICSDRTCASGWGGTSFAAPRWAGYLALVNQQAVSHGHATVGFINPTLYSLGLGSSHATNFHDITSGTNGTYSTETGYDLVTGWGSPNTTGLINSLAP
jgi:kumamolisin